MSVATTPAPLSWAGNGAGVRTPRRWTHLVYALVLVAEIVGLTVSFDTESLGPATSLPLAMLANASHFLRIGISATAVMFLMILAGVVTKTPASLHSASRTQRGAWIVAHGVALVVLISVTHRLF